MNFQQLRYVREAMRNGLNLTEVAAVLYTSQSGVSRQIKEFEDELGIELFTRSGKRLVGLTRAGTGAVEIIKRILAETENLTRYASEYAGIDAGRIIIAATHTQARYTLPKVIERFSDEFPKVKLELHQGTPMQVAEMLSQGTADVGVASEVLGDTPNLSSLPCFTWSHRVVVQEGHPLLQLAPARLADIAHYPIITYNQQFTGRACVDAAFAAADIKPDLRLTAMDSDVIKTYVRRGLGVGIVAEMALEDIERDGLRVVRTEDSLFGSCAVLVATRTGNFLPAYVQSFIEMLVPKSQPEEREAA